jgi:ferredoxin
MAYQILSDCINCDMCAPECPNGAISLQPVPATTGNTAQRYKKIFQIDPNLCTECEGFYAQPTCVEVCPIDVVIKA